MIRHDAVCQEIVDSSISIVEAVGNDLSYSGIRKPHRTCLASMKNVFELDEPSTMKLDVRFPIDLFSAAQLLFREPLPQDGFRNCVG